AGNPPRGFVTAPPQLDHHFLARFVFDGPQRLLHARLSGFELVVRQMRVLHDVGIDPQGLREALRQGRPGKTDVAVADPFVTLQAQVVELVGDLAAVALSRPAHDPVGEDGCRAGLSRRIVVAPRGDEEAEGSRLDVGHRFDDEGQPVRDGMRLDLLAGHPDGRSLSGFRLVSADNPIVDCSARFYKPRWAALTPFPRLLKWRTRPGWTMSTLLRGVAQPG